MELDEKTKDLIRASIIAMIMPGVYINFLLVGPIVIATVSVILLILTGQQPPTP